MAHPPDLWIHHDSMTTTPTQLLRITEICWEAAAAAAVDDADLVDAYLIELLDMVPNGEAIGLAAIGWATLVADHIVGKGPGGQFSATIENPDEPTEIFAAVVCAVGNRDIRAALDLLGNSEPSDAFDAATQLLGSAAAVLAHPGPITPRRL